MEPGEVGGLGAGAGSNRWQIVQIVLFYLFFSCFAARGVTGCHGDKLQRGGGEPASRRLDVPEACFFFFFLPSFRRSSRLFSPACSLIFSVPASMRTRTQTVNHLYVFFSKLATQLDKIQQNKMVFFSFGTPMFFFLFLPLFFVLFFSNKVKWTHSGV